MSIVQFQFSDSCNCNTLHNLFQMLKHKLLDFKGPRYVFIKQNDFDNEKEEYRVKQYEIVLNPITNQIKSLRHLKTFEPSRAYTCVPLVNEKDNELIICNHENTVYHLSSFVVKEKLRFAGHVPRACWYFLNGERYLILVYFFITEIVNWKTKELVDTLAVKKFWSDNFGLGENQGPFIHIENGEIMAFCLGNEDTIFKKHMKNARSLCYLNEKKTLIASCDREKVQVWDKNTKECLACEQVQVIKVLYSFKLNKLVGILWDGHVKCWDLVKLNNRIVGLNCTLVIQNSYTTNDSACFLDSKTQTQLLVGDTAGRITCANLKNGKTLFYGGSNECGESRVMFV